MVSQQFYCERLFIMQNLMERNLKEKNRQMRRITLWGVLANSCLMFFKIATGAIIRSSALIADGVHSLSDLVTDILVLVGVRLANRPADDTHPYGHGRFETFVSQVMAVILFAVGGGFIWTAGLAISRGKTNYPGLFMLVIAVLSVFVKEVLFQKTRQVANKTNSSALYANAWHHRSDALSSVAVLLGGVASILGWGYADHVAALIVGFLIMGVAGKIFYEGFMEFTDHAADRKTIQDIKIALDEEQDVCKWHALRSRKLGGELFIDLHLLCDPDLSVKQGHDISVRVEKKIKKTCSKPVNILIHIEPDSEDRHKETDQS